MDHHSFSATAAADLSRTSSVYSNDSDNKPAPLFADFRTGSRTGSRSTSTPYTPSFMSHHATRSTERLTTPTSQPNGHRLARKPVNSPSLRSPPDTPLQTSDSLPSPGVLLILIAAAVPPPTLSYLEMLLERQAFSTIAIAASTAEETVVKQLKIDIYALIGRLGKELGVLVITRDNWNQSEIENIAQDVTKSGESIQGVLCCPEPNEAGAVSDILSVSEAQLQHSWKLGTLFVHVSIKATAQSLLARCTPETSTPFARAPRGPFFLVASPPAASAAAQVTKGASDQLLHQLETATKAKGLTVGQAEAMLIPAPKVEMPAPEDTILQPDVFVGRQEDQDFTPSESPTKLWNMWALRNDIGYAD